jgi:hypothetical protein
MYSFCYKTIELLQDLAWPHHKVNNTKNPSLSQATKNIIKSPTLYIYIYIYVYMSLQMGFWSQVWILKHGHWNPKKNWVGGGGGGVGGGSTCDVSCSLFSSSGLSLHKCIVIKLSCGVQLAYTQITPKIHI